MHSQCWREDGAFEEKKRAEETSFYHSFNLFLCYTGPFQKEQKCKQRESHEVKAEYWERQDYNEEAVFKAECASAISEVKK